MPCSRAGRALAQTKTEVDPHIAAVSPASFSQPLDEGRATSLPLSQSGGLILLRSTPGTPVNTTGGKLYSFNISWVDQNSQT
jgi:hypothetical protein